MSDFTSNFWSVYVAGITLAGIFGCLLLLWFSGKTKAMTDSDNTTGHVWDGDLREMNNPLPRWWVGLFIITCVFSLAYLFLYPGLGSYQGSLNWSQTDQFDREVTRGNEQAAPIYAAFDAGLDIHVWVSETRPRNQGLLTAWELKQHGVPHTLIADNAAGLLLARGKVDAVIVGADRIAANGDVANKIGTYLKALAAREAGVPFYVAAPRSTIDFSCAHGDLIPIETRNGDELRMVAGTSPEGEPGSIRQVPLDEAVDNPAFDVTPAALVRSIITERGNGPASAEGLRGLFPEDR